MKNVEVKKGWFGHCGQWGSLVLMLLIVIGVVAWFATRVISARRDILTPVERQWLSEHDGAIRLATYQFPPAEFVDDRGRYTGITNEYVRLLEDTLDFRFRRSEMLAWDECLRKAKRGEIDVIGSIHKTPGRQTYLKYTSPYLSLPVAIVVRNDVIGAVTEDDLAGKKVGVCRGYAVSEYLEAKSMGIRLQEFVNDEECLIRTSLGEVDVAVVDVGSASYWIEKKKIRNLRVAGNVGFTYELGFACRKDRPIIQSILEKGLKEISPSKRREIYRRWIRLGPAVEEEAEWPRWTAAIVAALGCLCWFGLLIRRRRRRESSSDKPSRTRKVIATIQSWMPPLVISLLIGGGVVMLAMWTRVLPWPPREESMPLLTLQERQWLDDHEGKIVLAPDPHWPPIEFFDDKGKYVGLGADFVRLLEHKLGFRFKIERLQSWEEILKQTRESKVHFLPALHKTQERTTFLDFSEPYLEVPLVLITRRSFSGTLSLKDMGGRKVAIVAAYAVGEFVRTNYPSVKIVPVSKDLEGLRMAAFGEVDAMITDLASASYYIDKEAITNLRVAGNVGMSYKLHAASRKGMGMLPQIIQKGLGAITEKERQEIVAKWIYLSPQSIYQRQEFRYGVIVILGVLLCVFSVSVIWNRSLKRQVQQRTRELQNELHERKRAEAERMELEDRLRHAMKMEAIGQLAGGVAHDFNNILTAIQGNAELLKLTLATGSPQMDNAEQIVKSSVRAAELTRQLLAFARKGKFQAVPVDLHGTIREVIRLLAHTVDKRIEIHAELQAEPSVVMGDPSQLQNALLNLGVNARDAMPQGGKLTFATQNTILDETHCQRYIEDIVPGRYIQISVIDTGVGMNQETLTRIFEPFFTTKAPGKGTGLGLAGVYGCLRNHHGIIDVESVEGKGSVFHVFLPESDVSTVTTTESVELQPVHGTGRLLVVDDEEQVCGFVCQALKQLGYTVTASADGEDALGRFEASPNQFDLVILDLIMPKVSGEETFHKLREINPNLPVILSSGFSRNEMVNALIDQGNAGFIQKPFRIEELSREIARLLPERQ